MKRPRWRQPLQPAALAALVASLLSACAGQPTPPPEAATLASLAAREPRLNADPGIQPTPETVIAAYRQFIDVAVDVPQRAEALRRLGDLEMDSADRQSRLAAASSTSPAAAVAAAAPAAPASAATAVSASEAGAPDYRAARARYQDFLKTYPRAPRTDRVLYQLARAQEQAGELEAALATLTQLVTDWPGTLHVGEAQFRRGELLFALRDYAQAEAAYDAVLRFERRGRPADEANALASPLTERALHLRGWSLFKLGRLDEALAAFFELLDARLAGLPPIPREEAALADIQQLTRGERELLQDALRAISLCLAQLQGPVTLARLVDGAGAQADAVARLRRSYQFRVYESLAALYLQQGRVNDAADTLSAFVRLQPLHPQAPALLARVVQVYSEHGYTQQALGKRREFVARYGSGEQGAAFRRAQPTGWRLAQPQVQAELRELARHHHAQARQTRAAQDADEAARWYRELLQQFPQATTAAETRFLLGELLFENGRYTEAAAAYEAVADGAAEAASASRAEAASAQRAEARYAALLAYTELERQAGSAEQRRARQQQAVASALRFAAAHPADPRTAAVLVRAAEWQQDLGDGAQARASAQRALAARPDDATRRAAWVVVAQQLEAAAQRGMQSPAASQQQPPDSADLAATEAAWTEVLALTPPPQAARAAVAEKLAASIYRQGEQARAAGDARRAVGHFERAAASPELPATSPLRASAAFDAATALVGLQDWPAAAAALQAFRRQYPGHALQAAVTPKLARVHEALGQPGAAAAEFERLAADAESGTGPDATKGAELARSALWRAAELRLVDAIQSGTLPAGLIQSGTLPAGAVQSGATPADPVPAGAAPPQSLASAAVRSPAQAAALRAVAVQASERYLRRYPQPLEAALQARWQLLQLAQVEALQGLGYGARWRAHAQIPLLQRQIQQADATAGAARTARTRTLGGQAALALAEPLVLAYRAVPLVEPLARQLKLKKTRFEAALQAYSEAAGVGITEVTTAATYQSAALYQDFGRALLEAPRPRQLNAAEREQYAVMLEEQAFPFEEQAIALHEANARRSAAGTWDASVRASFAALARLKPARWGQVERGEARPLAEVEAALQAEPGNARLLNQQGLALRREGRFEEARKAYLAAIDTDPTAAEPRLNLAILHDLFLGDAAQAASWLQSCLALAPADAASLGRWLAELKSRKDRS